MTVAPERLPFWRWPRSGGAIALLLLALILVFALGACASSAAPGDAQGPAGAATAETLAGAPGAPAAVPTSPGQASPGQASPPSSAPSVAPAQLLATVLEPLHGASAFKTSVTVGDTVVVDASGRSVGAASQVTVTTADRTVEYLRVPPKVWAREQGGSWVLVAADPAPAAPLDVLSAPATLGFGRTDGTSVTLEATYPAAALGLKGDPVPVTIVADGQTVTFTYETTVSGRTTTSTTTVRVSPGDPIKPPGS